MKFFCACLAFVIAAACGRSEDHAAMPRTTLDSPVADQAAHVGTPRENPVSVDVSLRPSVVAAGRPARVTIQLSGSGKALKLEPIAGRRVHLIGVSRGLLWSVDEHPAEVRENLFDSEMTFPSRGQYVLFVLYRPSGDVARVHKTHLTVGDGPSVQVDEPGEDLTKLEPTDLHRHTAGYRVDLTIEPSPPKANAWTSLTFSLTRRDEPVTNLAPLDQLGHLILIREGAEEFVYAHSTEEEATGGIRARLHSRATPEDVGRADPHQSHGPDVTFHARFPKPGLYQVWADFAPGGKRIRADYVIRVE